MPGKRPKALVAAATELSPAAQPAPTLKKRSPKPRAAKEGGAPAPTAQEAPTKKPLPAKDEGADKKKRKLAATEDMSTAAMPAKKKRADTATSSSAPVTISSAALEVAQVAKTVLDVPQVDRAVRALLTHIERERATTQKAALFDDAKEDSPVHVLLATKQMPKAVGKAKACKPVPLGLPHPYLSLDTAEICLITKDPQREWKDKLAALGLRAKVIGVSKLKKKHKEFEAKRRLLGEYEVFLADARVLPMLPPLLGKSFFVKRKLPVAVDLTKADLRAEMQRAVCSCLYRHAAGTSNSVQVGTALQAPAHLVDNVVAAVEQAVKHIPGKWTNVQSLSLRTTNSVALPFYTSLPHE